MESDSSSDAEPLPSRPSYELETAGNIFTSTIQAFQQSLSVDDRNRFQEFPDPHAMVESMEQQIKQFKDDKKVERLKQCCAKINKFARALQPFFEVCSILVSSNPQYAAIAWGAIRLVFQLGSNFVTFLEKLTDMFAQINSTLPLYSDHVKRILSTTHLSNPESRMRLGKALSYVYADIIQFCQQACFIFKSRKRRCFDNTMRFAGTIGVLFWKPFDGYFGDILERLAAHEKLFEREMYLDDQYTLGKHFERYEAEIRKSDVRHEEMKRLGKEILRHRKETDTEFEARKHRESIKARHEIQKNTLELARKEKEALEIKLHMVKAWLDPPDFTATFEQARRTRLSGTCAWITQHQAYLAWRDALTEWTIEETSREQDDSSVPFPLRILSLQAKPGYGKSILSSMVIQDLSALPPNESNEIRQVAYFHFDCNHDRKRHLFSAWRAFAAQLVQNFKQDKVTIDLVSMLVSSASSGQSRGSDDEVDELLFVLLQRASVYLVVDGLDECEDSETLLKFLHRLCENSDTRIIFLSRPAIDFPISYRTKIKYSWRVRLDASQNFLDIELFLRQKLTNLLECGLLSGDFDVENTASVIAVRADGMFLWAKLLSNYLGCRALTIDERREALLQINLVEGLEALYGKIFGVLGTHYKKSQELLAKTFSWIMTSFRPMTIPELRVAVAIIPGLCTSPGAYIVDFEQSLIVTSLGLIEVPHGHARFIHSSVPEYITRRLPATSPFKINPKEAHMFMSISCLSHLAYDMPTKPLSFLEHTPTITESMLPPSRHGVPECDHSQNVVGKSPNLHHRLKRQHGSSALSTVAVAVASQCRMGETSFGQPSSKRARRLEEDIYASRVDENTSRGSLFMPSQVHGLQSTAPHLPTEFANSLDLALDSSAHGLHPAGRSDADIKDIARQAEEIASLKAQCANLKSRIDAMSRIIDLQDDSLQVHHNSAIVFCNFGDILPLQNRRASLDREIPFLSYASSFWQLHWDSGTKGRDLSQPGNHTEMDTKFLWILSNFLVDRNLVTTWVEGCCFYGFIPALDTFSRSITNIGQQNFPQGAARTDYLWMKGSLRHLALALRELRTTQTGRLLQEPAEIWGPQIAAYTDRNYWPTWYLSRREEHLDFDSSSIRARSGHRSRFELDQT